MADDTTVKQLLLQVDATTELLRRNLDKADRALAAYESNTQRRLDQTDRAFSELGRNIDIRPAIERANSQIGSIGVSVLRAQKQVEASSSIIRQSLLASASVLAGAFSADKVKDLADGYTRFTNQLKVAGVEGGNLSRVQQQLFEIAQRNGAPLEAIGTLYGRAAQAGKQLGASQGDLLRFTGAVGAALKIEGGSAEEAKGALLQLSQALGSGVVHAEEFNSVNEGLRPILQAAADASKKYQGNVGALRADVIAGKVTSQEFFQLILNGYDALQAKASKANLTIGASLETLNNALGRYIGQTDDSLSATARFAGGVKLLADNLDTIAPALTTIAIAYATVKAGSAALGGIDLALGAQRGLTAEVLKGNAAYIDLLAVKARLAVTSSEAAAAEVAGVEATLIARREERSVLLATIAEENALAATRRNQAVLAAASNVAGAPRTAALAAQRTAENDAAFAADRLAASRQRLAAVDAELAVAETELAVAQGRAAVATEAAAVATTAATFGARAAAAASALFAGTLTLVAAALPIIVVGAFVAALLHLRSEAAAAAAETKAFSDRHKEAGEALRQTASYGRQAASAITLTGTAAAAAAPGMLAYAGAVGEAAQRLKDLADRRRGEALSLQQDAANKAQATINQASARIAARRQDAEGTAGKVGSSSASTAADLADKLAIFDARGDLAAARREFQRLKALPGPAFNTSSELNNGRDVEGDLARVTRDLAVARKAGIQSQIDVLEAQKFELTQYKVYVKKGLSPQAAQDAASKDAADFREAAETKASNAATKKSKREGATAARQQAALIKDAASDERAFSAAERQAQDSIARSRQELSDSAAQRAQIERDRIEADRVSKNNELAQQAKTGAFGDAKTSPGRLKRLQQLNDDAAAAASEVVDVRERRRIADEQLDTDLHNLEIEQGMLSDRAQLATTTAERRAIELRLLALQKEEERKRIEAVLAPGSGASEHDRAIATVNRDTLDARYGAKQAVVLDQAAGPLAAYVRQAHKNTDDMNEALQGVAVDGLKSIEDGFVGIVTGTESVASAFKKMALSIVADLARIAIQKAIVGVLGNSFFGFGGSATPTFAGGGIPGYADGMITGPGTGTSDSILALFAGRSLIRVSNGESIVKASATRRYGPLIDAMNKDRLPKFAGGHVPRFAGGGIVQPNLTIPRITRGDMDAVRTARSPSLTIQLGDTHLNAPGADPAQLARLQSAFEQSQRELPAKVIQAYAEGRNRLLIRQ